MYIFVSSIGRTGTKFLSELFKKITNFPSYHSIEPHCTGNAYIKYNQGKRARDSETIQKKIRKIKSKSQNHTLFESSHVFLRCYATPAISKLPDVHVIHITRDPIETAKSYSNRGSFPGNKEKPWRLPLNLKRSLLYLPEKNQLTKLQQNLCDWLENEMRYAELKPKFTKTYDMYHSDLNDPEVYIKMFQHFGIKESELKQDKLRQVLTENKLNRNQNPKKTILNTQDQQEAQQLIEILHRNKIKIDLFRQPYYTKYQFIQDLIKIQPSTQ